MTIRIICIGKLKERYYEDAVNEFLKRLSRYAAMEIVELPDERAPEHLSPAQREAVKTAEGKKILARVWADEFVVAMAINGEMLSSEALASRIEECMKFGKSRIAFLIGGSLGLPDEVLCRADLVLSFGKQTYSHQIFRIMLLEQLYRSFKIISREPYHK